MRAIMQILDDLLSDWPVMRRTLNTTIPAFAGLAMFVVLGILQNENLEPGSYAFMTFLTGSIGAFFFAAGVLWGEESVGTFELLRMTPMSLGSIILQIVGGVAIPAAITHGLLFALASLAGGPHVGTVALKGITMILASTLIGVTMGLSCGGGWIARSFWRCLRAGLLYLALSGCLLLMSPQFPNGALGILAIGAGGFMLLHGVWWISTRGQGETNSAVDLGSRLCSWSGSIPGWASPTFWRDLQSGKVIAVTLSILTSLLFLHGRHGNAGWILLALFGGAWLVSHTASSAFADRVEGCWEALSLTRLGRGDVVRGRLAAATALGAIMLVPKTILDTSTESGSGFTMLAILAWWIHGSLWAQVLGTWMTNLAAAVFVSLFCAGFSPGLALLPFVLLVRRAHLDVWPLSVDITLMFSCVATLPFLALLATHARPLEVGVTPDLRAPTGQDGLARRSRRS